MDTAVRPKATLGAVIVATALVLGTALITAAEDAPRHAHGAGEAPARSSTEAEFRAANDAAMAKMMTDMDVAPTGDIDRDFVAMMVPHHQGAIDMALAVLRYGRNEQIRRLAQEIIVTQQQEIAAMRLAVGDELPAPQPAPTQISPAPNHH